MISFDGQLYEKESDIPDMGSITLVAVNEGRREYRGLSTDFSKLPKYDNLQTGSSCLFLDTGEYAEYMASDKTWYKL